MGVHYVTFGFIKHDKSDVIQEFEESGLTLYLPEIGESINIWLEKPTVIYFDLEGDIDTNERTS